VRKYYEVTYSSFSIFSQNSIITLAIGPDCTPPTLGYLYTTAPSTLNPIFSVSSQTVSIFTNVATDEGSYSLV
jgi:hypothetical protein